MAYIKIDKTLKYPDYLDAYFEAAYADDPVSLFMYSNPNEDNFTFGFLNGGLAYDDTLSSSTLSGSVLDAANTDSFVFQAVDASATTVRAEATTAQAPSIPQSYVDGTSGDDDLNATSAADFFSGHNGNDIMRAGDGDDHVWGDAGDDKLYGENGNDKLYGGSGADVVYGGVGKDLISGWTENDKLYGNAGDDEVFGGDGHDIIYGGSGDDFLAGYRRPTEYIKRGDDFGRDKIYGNAGDDFINGGDANDRLYGGSGDDEIWGGDGNDRIDAGRGNDILSGGAGRDMFIIKKQSKGSVNQVYGFDETQDRLYIDRKAYTEYDHIETDYGFDILHGNGGRVQVVYAEIEQYEGWYYTADDLNYI